MAPVRNVPAGTITRPPPEPAQVAIAAAKAAVFIVVPSPTAPKSVTRKCRRGNRGRRTEATIRSAAASAGDRAGRTDPGLAASTGAATPRALRRNMVRRSISDIVVLPGGMRGSLGVIAGRVMEVG